MKRRSRGLFSLLLLPLTFNACNRDEITGVSNISGARAASSPLLNGVIVFATEEFGAPPELAVMQPDGSGRRRITDSDRVYVSPTISPDGRRIAVVRFTSDGNTEGIFLLNADGSGSTLLVRRSAFSEGQPAWSPDGSQIAFQSFDPGPFGPLAKIFVINVDGTGVRQLSPPIDEEHEFVFDEGPSWSPDGTRIAFTRNTQLYIINADGSGFTPVPNEDGAFNAMWSPDGSRIVYQSMNPWGDIHVRNVDGSNLVALTTNTEQEGEPRWSGDGRRLVFERVVGGTFQLFVINADGTGESRLSFGTPDYNPFWSPFPPGRSDAGASVTIAPTSVKIAPADTKQFTATVTTTGGQVVSGAPLRWSSSDPAVATVTSSGLVTGIDNGNVEIRAVFASDTARVQVRVVDRVLRNTIVYSSPDEVGAPEFEAVRPDGTGRRRLTTDRFGYTTPDISPDGRRIVFSTVFSVFIIDADAAGITEGFTDLFVDFEASPDAPAWSPDGSQVAFSAIVEATLGGVRRIMVINADGSGLHQLTPDDPAPDDGPTWSPDGTRLIFTRGGVLYVINADGSGLTSLGNDDVASLPDWSPDGTRVAYGTSAGLRIRNTDGSNLVTVTSGQDDHPRWGPDNLRLVFSRVVDGKSQLFIVNADGSGEHKLSAGSAAESTPSWSPVP